MCQQTPRQTLRFFDLPPKVRKRIYTHLAPTLSTGSAYVCDTNDSIIAACTILSNTSRKMRAEALGFYFLNTRLVISIARDRKHEQLERALRWLASIRDQNIDYMRHVCINAAGFHVEVRLGLGKEEERGDVEVRVQLPEHYCGCHPLSWRHLYSDAEKVCTCGPRRCELCKEDEEVADCVAMALDDTQPTRHKSRLGVAHLVKVLRILYHDSEGMERLKELFGRLPGDGMGIFFVRAGVMGFADGSRVKITTPSLANDEQRGDA